MWPFVTGFLHSALCVQGTFTFRHIARIGTSFLFMADSSSVVWRDHILFIYLFIDRYLGCFHFLAVIDDTCIDICLQVLV